MKETKNRILNMVDDLLQVYLSTWSFSLYFYSYFVEIVNSTKWFQSQRNWFLFHVFLLKMNPPWRIPIIIDFILCKHTYKYSRRRICNQENHSKSNYWLFLLLNTDVHVSMYLINFLALRIYKSQFYNIKKKRKKKDYASFRKKEI